MKVSIICTLN